MVQLFISRFRYTSIALIAMILDFIGTKVKVIGTEG